MTYRSNAWNLECRWRLDRSSWHYVSVVWIIKLNVIMVTQSQSRVLIKQYM